MASFAHSDIDGTGDANRAPAAGCPKPETQNSGRRTPDPQTAEPGARGPEPGARRPKPGARTAAGVARAAVNATLTILLAPRCAACDALLPAPLDGPVCADCWSGILPITPPLCDGCGDPLPSWRTISREHARCARCRRTARVVVRSRAIGEYSGSLRAIVHALKYGGRTSIAAHLGAVMRERGAEVLDGADAVVPVPLHRRRERARGFNQADLLARALDRPRWPILSRVRETRPQVDLPEAQRHRNVRGAFALRRRGVVGQGSVVVLVDDVSTTGATLEACARVLMDAGAREVRALTAAKAVRQRP